MSADPSPSWLARVAAGDPEALNRAAADYEPVLRMMVRRHLPAGLRAKFDSVDVVQSVWGRLLDGFRAGRWHFPTGDHLKAFLIRAARNRLIDRLRQEKPVADRQEPGPAAQLDEMPAAAPPAGADAEAAELWRQVWLRCPPQHRELLRLKLDGLSLAEIAERTGLHPSSVRRVLYELAARLGRDGG